MRDGPVSAPGGPRLLPVIANQCVDGGPAKGHPLRGEEPQGSVAPPAGLRAAGSMADFEARGVAIHSCGRKTVHSACAGGAQANHQVHGCHCEPVRTLVWQSVLPAGKPGKLAAVWANSLRLTNSPKVLLFFAPCRGVTDCHVASLLAMTCRNMPGGCIIPGAAGVLPENAPATAVPEQISAYPSRQTPLHPRTRPSFCMSLRTSAWGPCKGCPFAGRGAPRERCSPLAFRRRGAWRTLGRRGVAIRSPRRETWQGGGSLGEFVTPYEFAQSTAVFCALPRGYGLPRRFAPRHDMQKHAGWLHNTGRCRCTAGKRPCNRSSGANFRVPFAPNALAPAHTSFLLHVIANQCAHWCGNPFSPQGNLASWQQFGRIRYALRIRPKYCCFLRPAAGLRIATSLRSSP